MNVVNVNNQKYEIVENYKDALDLEELTSLCTNYFVAFDYILGDYSYGKLRLKGFYDSKNSKVANYNNISNYKEYLKNYCATECKYFLLKNQNIVENNR